MNHSIHSADRATHLKVLIVALMAVSAVVALGLASRVNANDGAQTVAVVKAGKIVAVSSNAAILR